MIEILKEDTIEEVVVAHYALSDEDVCNILIKYNKDKGIEYPNLTSEMFSSYLKKAFQIINKETPNNYGDYMCDYFLLYNLSMDYKRYISENIVNKGIRKTIYKI